MKDKYAAWAQLSWKRKTTPPPPPIRVLNLPGFRHVEDQVHLLQHDRTRKVPPEVEAECEALSIRTFGISEADTKFDIPDDYWTFEEDSPERWRINKWWNEWERKFETPHLPEDDQVLVLKRLGLDFTDERGCPLHCLRFFVRQAEAAGKKMMGKIPDRIAADVNTWETKMEAEARKFKASRKR